MQKGLNFLLDKYSVNADATLSEDGKSVKIDGEDFPVLPWESERRFIELRSLVTLGRVGNMCTYRIGHTVKVGTDVFETLEREIGILEFTVNSKAKEIFAIRGKGTMNCIVETENGCVCTIEIGATLTEGEPEVDKHEIITDCGVACDRVVDTQIPQSSIYVRGNKSAAYTDTDAELYGYSELQINTIRNAFAIAKDEGVRASNKEKYEHIKKVVAAAKKSLDTLENIVLEA
jgi:hypothetical protein